MDEEIRKTIEEIMGQLQCPKNFKCAESEFEVLCKVKRIGLGNHLECLEQNPSQCKFASPFRNCYLCQCPIRVYIFEKLEK
jgi:hypothetical protein